MADFNLPIVTSEFQNVWDYVKAVQASLAVWQDGTTDTNIPTGSKRWSNSNRRFEEWSGTEWVELLPVTDSAHPFQIRVAIANECSGNAATADRADNSLALGGVLAAEFIRTADSRLSNSRQCNNAFDNAATARTNLSVNSAAEVASALASKASLESPALTGAPTAPTAGTGTNNTQVATTAFVQNDKTYMKPSVSLSAYIQTGWTDNGSYAVPIYQAGVRIAVDFYINVSGPTGGVNGVSPIFSFGDASPYDLRNLGVYMASDDTVCYAGYTTGAGRVDVRFSQETPTRLILDSRSSANEYVVCFQRRVYARDLI